MFVSLPTGSSKSLCHCLLHRVFNFLQQWTTFTLRRSTVVVVSPLISIMQDQVWAMIKRKVTAVYIGGADDMLEAEICAGNYQFVYCSLESLLTVYHGHDMVQSPILVGLVENINYHQL